VCVRARRPVGSARERAERWRAREQARARARGQAPGSTRLEQQRGTLGLRLACGPRRLAEWSAEWGARSGQPRAASPAGTAARAARHVAFAAAVVGGRGQRCERNEHTSEPKEAVNNIGTECHYRETERETATSCSCARLTSVVQATADLGHRHGN